MPRFVSLPMRRLKVTATLIATALGLAGCSFAPGLPLGMGLNPDAVARAQATASANAVAARVQLTPITPSLIREQAEVQQKVSAEVESLLGGADQAYRVGPGDVLAITVFDQPEFNTLQAPGQPAGAAGGPGYVVSHDGRIQFPFVGSLPVQGLTDEQIRDLLTQRLSRWLKKPQLTVRVQQYRSARIYVDGYVRTPGLQVVDDLAMTLPEAIGRSGGFLPDADRTSVALTRDSRTVQIDLARLVEQGVNPARILLRHGDMVRVFSREEGKVFVTGEVLKPGPQYLRDGRLRLNEVLGDAGGINPSSGDPRQVYVLRTQGVGQPEVYHLDASHPVAFALADGFALRPRDIVYVDAAPIVRWNRVISLLLPTAAGLNNLQDLRQ